MPGFVTHWLFLQRYYQAIPDSPLAALQHCRASTGWGALGPDVFFYDPVHNLRASRRFGLLLHRNRVGLSQRNLLQGVLRQQSDPVRAYAVGYLSHCVLDAVCHPYIYAMAGQQRTLQNRGAHYALETDIDRLLLQQSPWQEELKQAQLLDGDEGAYRGIARLLAQMCSDTYRARMTPRQAEQTMRNARGCMSLLEHPGRAKTVRRLEHRMLGYPCLSGLMVQPDAFFTDPLNLAKRPWIHPWTGQTSTQNLLELLAAARNQMLALTPALEAALMTPPAGWQELLTQLADRSLHTGLRSDPAAE